MNRDIENRMIAIREMEKFTKADRRSGVKKIEHLERGYNEYAVITFKGGGIRQVNISGNSRGATARAILDEAYRY